MMDSRPEVGRRHEGVTRRLDRFLGEWGEMLANSLPAAFAAFFASAALTAGGGVSTWMLIQRGEIQQAVVIGLASSTFLGIDVITGRRAGHLMGQQDQ